jgi:hypothetical protein
VTRVPLKSQAVSCSSTRRSLAPHAAYHVLAASAVSILPTWARVEPLLPALPVTERALIRPLGRSAMRALRWALSDLSQPS